MRVRFIAICVLLSISAVIWAESDISEVKDPDPWKGFNLKMHNFNEFFDKYLLKPVAKGYKKVTPEPVNKSVTNFFKNLGEPSSFVNDLLQAKPKDALVDLGRFSVNSTLGIFGLFDVATRFNWQRNSEDFGQTLGKWGVPSGPYLVLPLLGPSTLRDTLAKTPEPFTNVNPMNWADPHIDTVIGSTVLRTVDARADLLATEKMLFGDRYTAIRDFSMQVREFNVRDGDVEDDFGSDEDDW